MSWSQVKCAQINLIPDKKLQYLNGILCFQHIARINGMLPDFMDTGIDHLLSESVHYKTSSAHINIRKKRGRSQSPSVSDSDVTVYTETSNVGCRNSQKDKTDSLQNQSTVAAVISSVTATCLQITYQQHPSGIATAVNFFWLLSLALSIACALWSQLASRWTVSAFHGSGSEWISEWILTIPIILLSASSLAFAWGLICLAFSVFPYTTIPIVIVIVTSVTALVCVLVGTWLYVEYPVKKWFEHHKPAKSDIESSAEAPALDNIGQAANIQPEPLPEGEIAVVSSILPTADPSCWLD